MTTAPGLPAVTRIKDPQRRAEASARLLRSIEDRRVEILAVRDDACRELLNAGQSAAYVARLIGVTRAAVTKRFNGG